MTTQPFLILDFDGTLMDSVYVDVVAWQEAFVSHGYTVASWRIHRMNGAQGPLVREMLRRDVGLTLSDDAFEAIVASAINAYHRLSHLVQPTPGAATFLSLLNEKDIPWVIATSGSGSTVNHLLHKIGVGSDNTIVITREHAKQAKPDPGIFLAAAKALKLPIGSGIVIGDSTWDMIAAKRAGAMAVGVRTGGYGDDELFRTSAVAVYDDLAQLCHHLGDLGIQM